MTQAFVLPLGRSALRALLLLAALVSARIGHAEDWATRLGYPADTRVIILHAHDMGMCHEANTACAELLDGGAITSASAMAPCPWFAHAAEYAQKSETPRDVGLQLTLNAEWTQYRWGPVSGDLSPSLADGDGFLWRRPLQVTVNASVADVEREIRWQLLTAERLGMRPTHLASHLGTLFSRPDLTAAYLKFAREHWIPAIVVELTPEMAERFASQGYPIPDGLARTLAEYPLPKVEDLRIVPRTETYDEKVEATLALLAALPKGLSQVAFAPAVDSPALRAITPAWEQFVWDRELWDDNRIREALAAPDVVLTNWVEVMERFGGPGVR